jgi:hypothetical protein
MQLGDSIEDDLLNQPIKSSAPTKFANLISTFIPKLCMHRHDNLT